LLTIVALLMRELKLLTGKFQFMRNPTSDRSKFPFCFLRWQSDAQSGD